MKIFLTPILVCMAYASFAQKTVNMTDNSFQPSSLTVTPGTKVTWVNKSGSTQHTSTSGTGCKGDGKWNSGNIDPGGSFSYTFSAGGTYRYFCTPHCSAGMTGVIEVKGGGSAEPDEEKPAEEAPKATGEPEHDHSAHEKKKLPSNPQQRARQSR
jgi:plastocyanin